MSPNSQSAAAAGLLLATVAAALLFMHSDRPIKSAPGPDPVIARPGPPSERPPSVSVEPARLAALFDLPRAARARRPHPAGQPPPIVATEHVERSRAARSPLRYVGWVHRTAASRSFLFIDRATGRVFELLPGTRVGGWSLVEATPGGFMLSDGSANYAVEVRRQ